MQVHASKLWVSFFSIVVLTFPVTLGLIAMAKPCEPRSGPVVRLPTASVTAAAPARDEQATVYRMEKIIVTGKHISDPIPAKHTAADAANSSNRESCWLRVAIPPASEIARADGDSAGRGVC